MCYVYNPRAYYSRIHANIREYRRILASTGEYWRIQANIREYRRIFASTGEYWRVRRAAPQGGVVVAGLTFCLHLHKRNNTTPNIADNSTHSRHPIRITTHVDSEETVCGMSGEELYRN